MAGWMDGWMDRLFVVFHQTAAISPYETLKDCGTPDKTTTFWTIDVISPDDMFFSRWANPSWLVWTVGQEAAPNSKLKQGRSESRCWWWYQHLTSLQTLATLVQKNNTVRPTRILDHHPSYQVRVVGDFNQILLPVGQWQQNLQLRVARFLSASASTSSTSSTSISTSTSTSLPQGHTLQPLRMIEDFKTDHSVVVYLKKRSVIGRIVILQIQNGAAV